MSFLFAAALGSHNHRPVVASACTRGNASLALGAALGATVIARKHRSRRHRAPGAGLGGRCACPASRGRDDRRRGWGWGCRGRGPDESVDVVVAGNQAVGTIGGFKKAVGTPRSAPRVLAHDDTAGGRVDAVEHVVVEPVAHDGVATFRPASFGARPDIRVREPVHVRVVAKTGKVRKDGHSRDDGPMVDDMAAHFLPISEHDDLHSAALEGARAKGSAKSGVVGAVGQADFVGDAILGDLEGVVDPPPVVTTSSTETKVKLLLGEVGERCKTGRGPRASFIINGGLERRERRVGDAGPAAALVLDSGD